MPLGIMLSVPIIHNEVLMLSEETQLLGTFCLFCGIMYKSTNQMVADMLDARRDGIIKEHKVAEDAALSKKQALKDALEKDLLMLADIHSIADTSRKAMAELAAAKAMKMKHDTRQKYFNQLEAKSMKQDKIAALIRGRLIDDAVEQVTLEFNDKKCKAKSFEEAVAVIAGKKPQPTIVTDMFKIYFDAQKQSPASSFISEAQINDIDKQINSYFKLNQAS